MKKRLLLLASAALFSTAVFAQAVVFDGDALGLTSEYTDVPAGTVLGSNDAIVISTAFDDSYKTFNTSAMVTINLSSMVILIYLLVFKAVSILKMKAEAALLRIHCFLLSPGQY
jgi:hypothetical protein